VEEANKSIERIRIVDRPHHVAVNVVRRDWTVHETVLFRVGTWVVNKREMKPVPYRGASDDARAVPDPVPRLCLSTEKRKHLPTLESAERLRVKLSQATQNVVGSLPAIVHEQVNRNQSERTREEFSCQLHNLTKPL
jgi:hypothetical protein